MWERGARWAGKLRIFRMITYWIFKPHLKHINFNDWSAFPKKEKRSEGEKGKLNQSKWCWKTCVRVRMSEKLCERDEVRFDKWLKWWLLSDDWLSFCETSELFCLLFPSWISKALGKFVKLKLSNCSFVFNRFSLVTSATIFLATTSFPKPVHPAPRNQTQIAESFSLRSRKVLHGNTRLSIRSDFINQEPFPP